MEIHSYPLEVDPVELLQVCRGEPGFFLLESSLRQPDRGRYSYVGFDPFWTIQGDDLKTFADLEKCYRRFCRPSAFSPTPFSSGIVGYLSYDFGLRFERLFSHAAESEWPGFSFGFYDRVLTIDHLKKKLIISSTGWPETRPVLRKKRAALRMQQAEQMIQALLSQSFSQRQERKRALSFKSNFSKAAYCKAVQKALNYIKAGDIYQVNLAQEFSCELEQTIDAPALYRVLRGLSPSCFSGYLDLGAAQMISSSPEMFLRLHKGIVETRPMKGTRARGLTSWEDRRRLSQLRQNAKEKAELLMITDLERNDLGRVCDFGSVKVKQVREIEKYRTVYQATSTVTGRLAQGKNGFDLIKVCFPSGSVTGCPKIRAMEIIAELEPARRGIYTGALGYLSFGGDLALSVLIRTVLVQGQKASFHVGSGIVADSRPGAEYEETLIKARALRDSLCSMAGRN